MLHDILSSHVGNEAVTLTIISFIVGNVVRAFISPTRIEAKILTNIFTGLIFVIISFMKKWHKAHPVYISEKTDKIHKRIFALRQVPVKETVLG